MSPPPAPGVPHPRWLLRCRICAIVRPCTSAEVSQYMATGWPVCCGEIMFLVVVRDGKPGDDKPGTG